MILLNLKLLRVDYKNNENLLNAISHVGRYLIVIKF
jgi:hypothetical protein